MFEVGKKYKHRDIPYPLECYAVRGVFGWMEGSYHWLSGGFIAAWSPLWTEHRDPIKVSGWWNVYPDGTFGVHKTKAKADCLATPSRIACIYVTGTEGVEPEGTE